MGWCLITPLSLGSGLTAQRVDVVGADSYGVCQGEYRNNGLVSKIIIDRGPQFTSKFWSELMSKRDTKLGLSSSYHAQAYPTQMVREKELIELYNSM